MPLVVPSLDTPTIIASKRRELRTALVLSVEVWATNANWPQ